MEPVLPYKPKLQLTKLRTGSTIYRLLLNGITFAWLAIYGTILCKQYHKPARLPAIGTTFVTQANDTSFALKAKGIFRTGGINHTLRPDGTHHFCLTS